MGKDIFISGLVSIIMPSFNDSAYIATSIRSVLGQTYKNFELIIVDDCSSDGTVSIARSFSDPRIKLFENQKNQGAAYSRNVALRAARGQWIAFLDADDFWFSQKLEKQLAFMSRESCSFSYTSYYEAKNSLSPLFYLFGPKKITFRAFCRCCYVGCLTVMYDQTVVGRLTVNEDIKKRNDYALWLQVSKKRPCFLLKEPLAIYRRRQGGISSVSAKKKIGWAEKVFETYVTRSRPFAWFLAFRCAFFSLAKKKIYKKRWQYGRRG